MNSHFDYIITGGGCAGLSLLHNLLLQPQLSNKKILIIDKVNKSDNDRTWCFWEKENSVFEEIVFHRWSHLRSEEHTSELQSH